MIDNQHTVTYTLKVEKTNLNHLLVILVVILAFISGVLATRVWYLEKDTQNKNTALIANNTNPTQPTEQIAQRIEDVKIGHLPLLGEQNAKIKIVVFSDFQCPYCKRFVDETFKDLRTDYINTGKVALYFRHYPLPFHQNAQKAAESAECANEQDNFWQYHDILFDKQTEWSEKAANDALDTFISYAASLNLNTEKFSACLKEDRYKKVIEEDIADGQKYGVTGTPTSFINGLTVVGAQPYSSIKSSIDQELAK